MTVLSALQSAAVRLVGQKPTAFFSATGKLEIELVDLVNEVATDIMKAHDWRALTKLATVPGDGATEALDMPTDYDRMPVKAKVWSTSWSGMFFEPARDLDQWYNVRDFSTSGAPGWWLILQGKINIWPVLSATDRAQFYYISNQYGLDDAGAALLAFGSDTDTFKLPDRLLTLGLIWRWRAQKRLEYAEDLANYEKAMSEYAASDKGSNVIVVGNQRWPAGVNVPWPGVITP